MYNLNVLKKILKGSLNYTSQLVHNYNFRLKFTNSSIVNFFLNRIHIKIKSSIIFLYRSKKLKFFYIFNN